MGWEPLAASDPVPGDPGALRATAEHLELLGEALVAQAGRVKRIDPGECWVGLAAERFGDHRDEVPPALESAATRCFDAAAALKRYAPRLEEAQELAAEALRRARAASADMAEADQGVDAMARHDTTARRHADEWNAAHADAPPHPPDLWSGPDWPALLAGAEADLEAARRLLDEAVEVRDRAATTAVADIEAARADDLLDPWFTAGASWVQALFGWFWSRPGPGELSFVVTGAGLVLNTVESWQHEALRSAGIDPDAWDPARGLAANDAPVQAAWELYARLYADNPDQFLWAGMAKLAGATFYAGFQDLHVLRRAIEDGTLTAEQVEEVLEKLYPGLPDPVVRRLVDLGADDLAGLAGELRYVETTFLRMQRNIFDDLAWQHVAYQEGGIDALLALNAERVLKDEHLRAWRHIDSGDTGGVQWGNLRLLRYEQDQIIGDDYDAIRNHSEATWLLTLGMSVVAESPIPGGRPFREVVPYEVKPTVNTPDRIPVVPDRLVPDRVPFTDVPVPGGGGVSIDTPDEVSVKLGDLPLNNVSIFEKRWQWIERDMYPAWVRLVSSGAAGDLVATPIGDLAAERRTIPDSWLRYEPGR
ncbi:MAG TPA: hypothetical protein VGR26_13365 [Acidimicrobiales bacterium]|nr:hypothetical protein [Acidimicrobiales bacterium]